MTNNPTIDGVSRDTIQRAIDVIQQVGYQDKFIDYDLTRNVQIELRALLDAPAVERQPKGAILRFREYVGKGQGGRDLWRDWTEWSTGTVEYAKSKLDQTKDLTHIQFEVEWLYSDTPEVAALQSTIARLEARVAQLESEKEFAAATYQAARDRIAELESGRGEPVAVVTSVISRREKRFAVEILDNQKLHVGTWLFTAPPAPVAVALPELESAFEKWWEEDGQYCRAGGGSYEKTFAYRAYEACLDATAALNGPAK